MKKYLGNWFSISIILIILLSIFLRFFQYDNRWGLASDQAYDTIVARYAVKNLLIPPLGRFSSAGPFQTGGEWFWLIMIGIAIFPYSVISPWIFLTVLYVFFVFLIIVLAKEIVGKEFAIIIGILAATSTAEITQGTNLTNQSPLSLVALFAIWAAIRFIRNKKNFYLFLLSFFVGLGASFHLQGVALAPLLIVTLFIAGLPDIKRIIIAGIGVFLPWSPVYYIELQNKFFNTRSMLQYYLHDQYSIPMEVLGRRWLTYLGVFWPNSWALVSGGFSFIVYLIIILGLVFLFKKVAYKSFSKEWIIICISFIFAVYMLRFVRTPLFDSYLVFLHPLILLITGIIIYLLYTYKKIIGLSLLLLVIIGNFFRIYTELHYASNTAYGKTLMIEKSLQKYGKSFTIYDYQSKLSSVTLPAVLTLYTHEIIDERGHKVGFIKKEDNNYKRIPVLFAFENDVLVVNLKNVSNEFLLKDGWEHVDPKVIYQKTEEWYKK